MGARAGGGGRGGVGSQGKKETQVDVVLGDGSIFGVSVAP